jgi:hypothetical protein
MAHDEAALAGHECMPGLRIAVVALPALLAELIQHGLCGRMGSVSIIGLADLQRPSKRLIQADVVIVSHSVRPALADLIRTILPDAKILRISSDLSQLVDVESGESNTFTFDALAGRLRR